MGGGFQHPALIKGDRGYIILRSYHEVIVQICHSIKSLSIDLGLIAPFFETDLL